MLNYKNSQVDFLQLLQKMKFTGSVKVQCPYKIETTRTTFVNGVVHGYFNASYSNINISSVFYIENGKTVTFGPFLRKTTYLGGKEYYYDNSPHELKTIIPSNSILKYVQFAANGQHGVPEIIALPNKKIKHPFSLSDVTTQIGGKTYKPTKKSVITSEDVNILRFENQLKKGIK